MRCFQKTYLHGSDLDLARRAESMGRPILTAPVDRDLEVAVLDTDFEHALARAVGISWCLDQRDK